MSETTLFRFAKSDDAGSFEARRVRAEHKQRGCEKSPTNESGRSGGGSGSALRAAEKSYLVLRVGVYAARTDLPRSLAIACRSIWRTRSAVMPQRAPISASLACRPSISP